MENSLDLLSAADASMPRDIQERISGASVGELEAAIVQGFRVLAVVSASTGWALKALKLRLGHGNFKPRLKALGISYPAAAQAMRLAETIAQFPAFAQIENARALRKIAYLPLEQQETLETELLEADDAPVDWRGIPRGQRFFTWALDRVARARRDSDLRGHDKEGEKAGGDESDRIVQQIDALESRVSAVCAALSEIAEMKIAPPQDDDELLHRGRWLRALERSLEEARKNLFPTN